MYYVSTIMIHDTLQTTFPLSYAVINEAPLQHYRLLQLINGVDSLLRGPKWCNSPDLNPGCWGMSGSMQATFSRRRSQ